MCIHAQTHTHSMLIKGHWRGDIDNCTDWRGENEKLWGGGCGDGSLLISDSFQWPTAGPVSLQYYTIRYVFLVATGFGQLFCPQALKMISLAGLCNICSSLFTVWSQGIQVRVQVIRLCAPEEYLATCRQAVCATQEWLPATKVRFSAPQKHLHRPQNPHEWRWGVQWRVCSSSPAHTRNGLLQQWAHPFPPEETQRGRSLGCEWTLHGKWEQLGWKSALKNFHPQKTFGVFLLSFFPHPLFFSSWKQIEVVYLLCILSVWTYM